MPSFSVWDYEKNNLLLTILIMFWKIGIIYFFFCSIQKINSNCSIVFLNFFQSSFLMENLFLSSCIYLYIKGLSFVIFCRSFSISSWFNANWDNVLRAFIIFTIDRFFIQSGEPILIHHDSHLFYDIYNALNEHTWRQIQYL